MQDSTELPHSGDASPPRALKLWGYGLAAWSFAFMLPHLVWALGGRIDPSVIRPSAAQLAHLREINGWASLILALATGLGIALVRCRGRPALRGALLGIAWAGTSIALAHGAYGIAARARAVALKAAGPGGFDPARDSWLLWDLLLFEPWFLVEGILILLAGWHFLSGKDERRRWLLACLGGAGAAFIAALAELRIG